MKFGGSSVGTPEAVRQAAGLVARSADRKPVVVVSALQGVTDHLLSCAEAALSGDRRKMEAELKGIVARHAEVIDGLELEEAERASAQRAAAELLRNCQRILGEIFADGQAAPARRDEIVSYGERLSAPIVAAAFRASGLPASAVDARELILTDDHFTAAEIDFAATNRLIAERLAPLAESGRIPVVTGFIGATKEGATTTIGRGGSDYTASILGGALGADEIWIWKEVDGVMTADPRVAPDAAVLEEISYDEAAEMSYFGAKVLHPKSMIPAMEAGIPMRIRNAFRPEVPGTRIGFGSKTSPDGVKAVTAIKRLAIVTVEGKGMAGIAGFAAQVFGIAGRLRINILMFSQSSSEQNICLVVAAPDAILLKNGLEAALTEALSARWIEAIDVEPGVAAVAAVGDGMRGRPGVAAKVFGAVAAEEISVRAIAQGSSERNISFVVAESDADRAVRAIHSEFELQKLKQPYAIR